jgi:hypothetical protein
LKNEGIRFKVDEVFEAQFVIDSYESYRVIFGIQLDIDQAAIIAFFVICEDMGLEDPIEFSDFSLSLSLLVGSYGADIWEGVYK